MLLILLRVLGRAQYPVVPSWHFGRCNTAGRTASSLRRCPSMLAERLNNTNSNLLLRPTRRLVLILISHALHALYLAPAYVFAMFPIPVYDAYQDM